ncbi:MAG: hypothetical protein IPM39_18780 [Chloroflexi bacterium]|nr:hypothetical protein [Chloroflexota bacterium]
MEKSLAANITATTDAVYGRSPIEKTILTQVTPQTLPLAYLRHHCAQESGRFFNRQAYDPRFCYELFRRAILQRDQEAWDAVYHQYERLVTHWVERHAAFLSSGEESQFFMNRAFEKMWLGITPDKFATFADLPSILRYLQMCVHSVMIDFTRQREQKLRLEAIEEMSQTPHTRGTAVEDHIAAASTGQELWRWLQTQCKDQKEERVLVGLFVLALKPRELYDLHPDTFSDIKEIYRVKENLVARLRRSEELKTFF